MISTGLAYVIAPLVGTIASTAIIINTTSTDLLQEKGSYAWYVASIALAMGHFAFVPAIMPKIKGLSNGGLAPVLRQWMRVHITRSVTDKDKGRKKQEEGFDGKSTVPDV
ncbi:hypothetical protein N0V82_002963 [Gnomoniopsis sp. IMI 355080]|nr:hypothetical protein N0V82_002963 [Gnomoniopsis sp. IMI 355080]